jgi:hypothetical protein
MRPRAGESANSFTATCAGFLDPHPRIRTRQHNAQHCPPGLSVFPEQSDDQLSQLLLFALIHLNHLRASDALSALPPLRNLVLPPTAPGRAAHVYAAVEHLSRRMDSRRPGRTQRSPAFRSRPGYRPPRAAAVADGLPAPCCAVGQCTREGSQGLCSSMCYAHPMELLRCAGSLPHPARIASVIRDKKYVDRSRLNVDRMQFRSSAHTVQSSRARK